eukprot:63451_1
MGAVCACCRFFCPCCVCCCPEKPTKYIGVTDSDDEIGAKSIKIQVQAPKSIPNDEVQLLSDYDAAQPAHSGFGPFKNKYSFNSKQNVILQHHFGASLMNKNSQLSKNGADDDSCVWTVEFEEKHLEFMIVKLMNKSSQTYLRIIDNGEGMDCLGTGGKHTHFKVHQTDDNCYKFESVLFAGKHISVNKEGVTVNDGNELSIFHIWTDSIDEASSGDQSGSGAFIHPFLFNVNQQTVIIKHYYGKTLGINPKNESDLGTNGGIAKLAQFCVEIPQANDSKAQLKSIQTGKYIQMTAPDKLDCLGTSEAKYVQFKVHRTNANLFKFESGVFEGKYIAVNAHGAAVVGIGDDLSGFTVWSNAVDDEKQVVSDDNENDEEERVWYDNIEDLASFLKKQKKKKKDTKIEFTAEFWRALNKNKAKKFDQVLLELGEFVGVTNFDLRMTLWERVDGRRKKLNTMTGLTKLLYQLVIEYINQKDKKRKKPEEKNVKAFMQYLAQNIIELENFPSALKTEMEKEVFARSIDNWMTALIEKYRTQ